MKRVITIGPDRRMASTTCPTCKRELTTAFGFGTDKPGPELGDRMMCIYCGTISIFTLEGFRLPTAEEQAENQADPDIALAQATIAAMHKEKP